MYALIYLDDVIVFSRTEEEHLTRLQAVFEQFQEHGLKLKPLKCHFLRKEITFLGHKVSEEGMKPGDNGLKGIAEMAPPANYTEIPRFLGATRFFWRFIKNYTWIAKPLNDLLEGEASKWKTQPVDLPPEAKEAFDILKMKCMTAPVLAFADFEKPFCLETDTSSLGLGAVLSQKQDNGKFHLVAYASWELKGGEGKYQWVAALAGYNMTIEYLKDADNKVADILSRVPQWLDPEAVTVLLNHTQTSDVPRAEADDPQIMVEHHKVEEEVILWAQQMVRQDKRFQNLMNRDWVDTQMQDPVISQVIGWIRRPKSNKNTLDEFMRAKGVLEVDRQLYAQRQSDFILRDNLLFLNMTPANSTETCRYL